MRPEGFQEAKINVFESKKYRYFDISEFYAKISE
jgi:hypothetical protein